MINIFVSQWFYWTHKLKLKESKKKKKIFHLWKYIYIYFNLFNQLDKLQSPRFGNVINRWDTKFWSSEWKLGNSRRNSSNEKKFTEMTLKKFLKIKYIVKFFRKRVAPNRMSEERRVKIILYSLMWIFAVNISCALQYCIWRLWNLLLDCCYFFLLGENFIFFLVISFYRHRD